MRPKRVGADRVLSEGKSPEGLRRMPSSRPSAGPSRSPVGTREAARLLSLPIILSGAKAFEISDIQDEGTWRPNHEIRL